MGAAAAARALWTRLSDPRDTRAALAVAALLLAGEAVLCALIIWRVPYTEIDWEAYMQQVETYDGGERDYERIRGATGPLVYPAGFVYFYAALRRATGGAVAAAQPLFAVLYLATLALVLCVYITAQALPPAALPLLCLSKRLHSIYVLRLFNDGVAMLPAFAAVALAQRGRWYWAALAWSCALSVKMNALLFAPPLALLMLRAAPLRTCVAAAALALALQAALAAPFLAVAPRSYAARAFDFSRVFEQRWSVNLQFLPAPVFASRGTAVTLLALHLALLAAFAHRRWLSRDAAPGLPGVAALAWARLRGGGPAPSRLSAEHAATLLLEGNLIGIVAARSLHFQFYAWYCWSLPYLAWRSALPLPLRLALLAAMEAVWNVYPPRAGASAALAACHLVLLAALLAARMAPPDAGKGRAERGEPPRTRSRAKRA